MLRAFEDGNTRVLVKYHEIPVYKPGGQELETIPGNDQLAKQQHLIAGVEIIDITTKVIIRISFNAAMAISEKIREILEETPPPVPIDEADCIF